MYGALIYEIFNGPFSRADQLKQSMQIPSVRLLVNVESSWKALVAPYRRLLSVDYRQRPSVGEILQQGVTAGGYFDNPFIATVLFLENITVKDVTEKAAFFKYPTLLLIYSSAPENYRRLFISSQQRLPNSQFYPC